MQLRYHSSQWFSSMSGLRLQRVCLHHHDCRRTLTQMYNNCAETDLRWWSSECFCLPIDCRSQLWRHVRMRALATAMTRPNASAIACVNERMAILFSVWKLQIQLVTSLWMSPISYRWPCCSSSSENPVSYWNSTVLTKPVILSISLPCIEHHRSSYRST